MTGGVNPQNMEHAKYLNQFCQHVYTDLKMLIDRALACRVSQCVATKELYLEVLHHASFCVDKKTSFLKYLLL